MNYIKRFNENSDEMLKVLLNQSEEHLAYLIDDVDWEISVSESGFDRNGKFYSISIDYIKEDEFGGLFFSLKKVRDKIIPYLQFMMNEYHVENKFFVYYENVNDEMKNFTIEQLDRKNMNISYIMFKVQSK